MTVAMKLDLTSDEESLLASIEFDAKTIQGYAHAQKNADAVVALMDALVNRMAIPKIRAAWFEDPKLNAGGNGRSIRDSFARSGARADDIFRHIHFLPYLRYFIFGPNLPRQAIEAFQIAIVDCGMITSGDVMPIAKVARALTRQHKMRAQDAAEEFYKLALELNMDLSFASTVREYVKKTSGSI